MLLGRWMGPAHALHLHPRNSEVRMHLGLHDIPHRCQGLPSHHPHFGDVNAEHQTSKSESEPTLWQNLAGPQGQVSPLLTPTVPWGLPAVVCQVLPLHWDVCPCWAPPVMHAGESPQVLWPLGVCPAGSQQVSSLGFCSPVLHAPGTCQSLLWSTCPSQVLGSSHSGQGPCKAPQC